MRPAGVGQDGPVPTHIALLRAVNVGGVKVTMAELRAIVQALGHAEVSTYIQTGNVLFTPASGDPCALARDLEQAISNALGIRPPVIVITRKELGQVVSGTPFPDEQVQQRVHVVFLPAAPGPGAADAVAEAERAAAAGGSRDRAVLTGRTLYLHTPDGFGRSGLVRALLLNRRSPVADGTARNFATVTKLLELASSSSGQ
jgi:uncharacterized protein (DUF1697 family)